MLKTPSRWLDQDVERIMGTLLRVGVSLSAATVLLGGMLYLARYGGMAPQFNTFAGEPSRLTTLRGIVESAWSLSGRGIMQFGLLLLIGTPVARVIFAIVAFAFERDRLYVVVALIVFGILLFSLCGGTLAL